MNVHDYLKSKDQQAQEEKEAKQQSLEKQLKMWRSRLDELRKVGSSALDPAFIRRQCDKCTAEIDKIVNILSKL